MKTNFSLPFEWPLKVGVTVPSNRSVTQYVPPTFFQNQRRIMENNAEDSDDESQIKKVRLMKEHVEQKMAVLQGRKLDWNDELESVSIAF